MENKRRSNLVYVLYCALGFLLFTLSFEACIRALERHIPQSQLVESGWNVTVNGIDYTKERLTDVTFPVVSVGDVVSINGALPRTSLENPVLRLEAWYCVVDVFINGRNVYSYGREQAAKGKNTGCGYHAIPLKGVEAGAKVNVRLLVSEPRSFTSPKPIYIESAQYSFPSLLRDKLLVFIASIFFFAIGLCGIIVSAAFWAFGKKKTLNLLLIANLALWLGLEGLYHNDCMEVFCSNYSLNSWIEHVSLYGLYIAMLGLFCVTIPTNRRDKYAFIVLSAFFVVYCISACILDALGVMHLPATRSIFFVSVGAGFFFAIFVAFKTLFKSKREEKLPSIGFLVMLLIVCLDMGIYLLVKYVPFLPSRLSGSGIVVGALIFFVALIVSMLLQIRPQTEVEVSELLDRDNLRSDYLTSVHNELAFNETIAKFEEGGRSGYSAIALRLEPAGESVPRIGTVEGDMFLIEFVEMMKGVFKNKSSIFRMMDSTFCVLYGSEDDAEIKPLLDKLDDQVYEKVQLRPREQYLMAVGIAHRSDVARVTSLFQLAFTHLSREF